MSVDYQQSTKVNGGQIRFFNFIPLSGDSYGTLGLRLLLVGRLRVVGRGGRRSSSDELHTNNPSFSILLLAGRGTSGGTLHLYLHLNFSSDEKRLFFMLISLNFERFIKQVNTRQ